MDSISMHDIDHTYVSLLADVSSLTGFSEIRGSYEGLSWCLKEAPQLEKLLLESVETGRKLDLDRFPNWLHRIALGSLEEPMLMRYVRQLLLFCYKASVTHDQETTKQAFMAFIDTNRDVGSFGHCLSRQSPWLLDAARRHCQSVLYKFNGREIIPSNGPGAVTTSKLEWQNIYSTIEYLYPFSDYFCLSYDRQMQELWDHADHDQQITAKLIAVPKDSRGPRLICVHPAEAIWIQQGIRRELERVISLHRVERGPWPKGRIKFDDQTNNGRIALNSSLSRRYATIDLKEASDRISEPLVQILFGDKYKYFGSCRAQSVKVPAMLGLSDSTLALNSYAPMGNATTFPVQSLVFWAICVSALQRLGLHQPGACFVFGDDIIIPTGAAQYVIDALESFGLLVNRTKSFWRGAFRESCGIDAFKGVDVTPVRWKTTIDTKHLSELQSLSDIAMRLRTRGYVEAAITAYDILRKTMRYAYGKDLFLTNNPDHGGIAEYSTNETSVWRDAYWHRDFQWFHSPVYRIESLPDSRIGCHSNGLLESVCSLERQGRGSFRPEIVSRRSRLVRGWIRVE